MKVLLFWKYYDAHLEAFYKAYPEVLKMSYSEHLQRLLDHYSAWPGAVMQRLSEFGVKTEVIICNAKPLQKQWAIEHGIDFNLKTWEFDLPYEQIRAFHPDVLWISSMFEYYGSYLKNLKQFCRSVFAWVSCPWSPELDLSGIDCIVTSDRELKQSFISMGAKSEVILPAFEPRILDRLNVDEPHIPISFVGSVTPMHGKRTKILNALAQDTSLMIWGHIGYRNRVTGVRSLTRRIYSEFVYRNLLNRYEGPVWGIDMYQALRNSYMTVNANIDMDICLAGNMRMFEATGVGTLLITDDAPNIKDLFEPDLEVVVYKSYDELIEKINYYLEHEDAGRSIATAGQKRTLSEHTTFKRSQEWLKVFQSY